MLEDQNPYSFEKSGRGCRRDDHGAKDERRKLSRRLGFTDAIPSTSFDGYLLRLAVHCNLSIEWYQSKLSAEVRARRWYFAISLGLLLLIPLGLYAIARYAAEAGHPATAVATQLSAVLTGLLAFQRGISAWLDRRQVVGAYSKACSELKSILYEFEQAWDTKAINPVYAAEFTAAIRRAVAKCQSVLRTETDSYYQTLSYPTLDLGSLVKSAASDAGSLVSALAPDLATAARIEQLRRKVAEIEAQLARARAAKDTAGISALTLLRDDALRELRAAELKMPGSRIA
jgi:hypothetical protein